jgi:hypothetical protein
VRNLLRDIVSDIRKLNNGSIASLLPGNVTNATTNETGNTTTNSSA